MGCELDKVVEAINKVASGIRNPQAINQLNELKNDLSTFARSMEVAKPVRDFSRLRDVMGNVEVNHATKKSNVKVDNSSVGSATSDTDNGKDYSKLTDTLKNRVKDYTKFVTSDKSNINVMRKLEDGSYGDFGNPFSRWTVKGNEEDLSAMFYDWLVNNNIPATYLEGESNRDKRLKGINFQRGKIIDKLNSIANKDLYYEGTAKGKDLSHASTLALIASLYNEGKLSVDKYKKQNVLSKSGGNVEITDNYIDKAVINEDPPTINVYSGDNNGFSNLSNFNAGPITLNGKEFPTLEHAFQYWKATVASVEGMKEINQRKILDAKSGADAQKAGKSIKIDVSKWPENVSTKALTTIMTRYYEENAEAMDLLQSTKGKTLTHIGRSGTLDARFPAILMKIRDNKPLEKNTKAATTPTTDSTKEETLPEARKGLTRGQTKAYDDLADILTSRTEHTYLLEGPGGTGKSFVIGKVLEDYVDNYKDGGVPVIIGSAVAHAAKDVLGDFIEDSLGEDANVKFKRNVALQLGKVIDNHTTSKDNNPLVIVLDEVSMVDSISINMLLHKVEFANSVGKPTKIVLLGDRAQLRPIMTTDRYKVEVKSVPGGESYNYITINSIAYMLNSTGKGLVNISEELVSGNVIDGKFVIDADKFDKLTLKSKIFMNNLRGTTLLENMRNPELAKIFDKFRTGDDIIETSKAAENQTKYATQYSAGLEALKAAKNSKGEDLAVDLSIEALPNDVFNSWINGKTSVVAYKNDTVRDINDRMTKIAAHAKGEKATLEVSKYGVFTGQAYRSTVNMLTPGMPTTKTTNNTLATVTDVGNATDKLHNGTLEVAKGQSTMLYEGSAVLDLVKGKFREDPDNLYVYGLRLNMKNIPSEIKKNITIGTVKYPKAGEQNVSEEIAGILGYTGNVDVTKLVKEYGEVVQYMYVEGDPTEVDTYSLGDLNYKAFEGIASAEFDIESFRPTFAMTVHKSQGQTLENVIVVDEWSNWSFMSKVNKLEAMYVAVSRSKTKVVLAGSSHHRLMNIAESKKKDAIIAPINSKTARNIQGCNK